MTVDELKEHLDRRLDAQDRDRRDLARAVGKVDGRLGKLEERAANAALACEARHTSNRKRLNRVEGGFIAIGVAAFWFCIDYAKKKLAGEGG